MFTRSPASLGQRKRKKHEIHVCVVTLSLEAGFISAGRIILLRGVGGALVICFAQ